MVISDFSYIQAKKAFQLAQQEHAEKERNVNIRLEQAFKEKNGKVSYAYFLLNIINQSSMPKSIVRFHLEVNYVANRSQRVSILKLNPHYHPDDSIKHISQPLNLPPKATKTGSLAFELPERLKEDVLIEYYKVIAYFEDDKEIGVFSYLLNEK